MRPMFEAFVPDMSVTFVSQKSIESGAVSKYGLSAPLIGDLSFERKEEERSELEGVVTPQSEA